MFFDNIANNKIFQYKPHNEETNDVTNYLIERFSAMKMSFGKAAILQNNFLALKCRVLNYAIKFYLCQNVIKQVIKKINHSMCE